MYATDGAAFSNSVTRPRSCSSNAPRGAMLRGSIERDSILRCAHKSALINATKPAIAANIKPVSNADVDHEGRRRGVIFGRFFFMKRKRFIIDLVWIGNFHSFFELHKKQFNEFLIAMRVKKFARRIRRKHAVSVGSSKSQSLHAAFVVMHAVSVGSSKNDSQYFSAPHN